MKKQPKFEGVREDCYVKAWARRNGYIVQVWLSGKPNGEPDGDWEMPKMFGLDSSIAQSICNTRSNG